jgi:5-methylcytosine-specific restriction endonuclease McrA
MRDNFACLYCGTGIEQADIILTLDHVQHRGGNEASNLVTACFDCNLSKGAMSLKRFLREVVNPERALKRIKRALARGLEELLPEAKRVIASRRKAEEPF